ncbi:hypothetical protein CTheo_4920 [Ceratobasidium theobromae]|uniref:Uncharacterized protein n=1 Tax=Ceratobasidium theobromae TaxID=1582974 RepID=A0A5N5QIQ6_9AGAM|nr:hypothetical protein CTheo_4920 [Ceratobasidium theobromae]
MFSTQPAKEPKMILGYRERAGAYLCLLPELLAVAPWAPPPAPAPDLPRTRVTDIQSYYKFPAHLALTKRTNNATFYINIYSIKLSTTSVSATGLGPPSQLAWRAAPAAPRPYALRAVAAAPSPKSAGASHYGAPGPSEG